MCKNCIKYQYVNLAVCAYEHGFRKWLGRVLIGACALESKIQISIFILQYVVNNI